MPGRYENMMNSDVEDAIFKHYGISKSKDQVCRKIPNYSERAYIDSHMYDSDPYRQLDVFRQEFGDSWAGGYYDEQKDLLSACMLKEQRTWDFFGLESIVNHFFKQSHPQSNIPAFPMH